MNRRDFSKALLSAATASAAPARPNIVYILCDDLGWGDLGCYNPESRVPTPVMDHVAGEGVRFTDMHSPSAVCTPTRYGILTGRYSWRGRLKSGVLWGSSPNLIERGRPTVASMLKSAGYYTAGIGKWHLGLGDREKTDFDQPLRPGPLDHGFDSYFGIPASLDMEPYLYFENDRVVEKATGYTEGRTQPRGVFWRPGPIAPHFKIEEVLPTLTRRAVDVVRDRARKPAQPFFLYLPLSGPHTPWMPLPPYRGRSQAGDYGDFVTQVDDSIGSVVRTLEETKLSPNTLLIITSDNGAHWTPEDKARFAHRANANWRGMKADIWDAGHRIPFLARWPGHIKPGSVSQQLGCLTDLMATVGDVTGFRLPRDAGEDSFSLLPALTGAKPSGPVRDAVVHHSSLGMFSIRQGAWKLVFGRGSGGFSEPKQITPKQGEPAGELYNLEQDPSEETNLYLKDPDRVASLTALLERYQRDGRSRPT